MALRFGVDRIVTGEMPHLRIQRIGLVTSNVATTAFNGETSRVALRRAGFNLVRLFGPEHGLSGTAADGTKVADDIDPATQLPVVSLYGEKLRPPAESLADLDVVVYDIPDVGARFYTYMWTLSHVMEACAAAGKPIYVLDRPNPLGGDLAAAEGPILDEANVSSFVGRWAMPVRYSLTIGELAGLWNGERQIGADLKVVPVRGWSREQNWPQTRLPFVRLSPAMASYETALLYPGTCLFEGTNVSEGRGTDSPFRLIGAPWIEADRLTDAFNALHLPGVTAQPETFIPQARKHAGTPCHGVRLDIADRRALRPVKVGLHLLAQIKRLHPLHFEWLSYPSAAAGSGINHFDKLIGRREVRAALDARASDLQNQITAWTNPGNWATRVRPYLLYAETEQR